MVDVYIGSAKDIDSQKMQCFYTVLHLSKADIRLNMYLNSIVNLAYLLFSCKYNLPRDKTFGTKSKHVIITIHERHWCPTYCHNYGLPAFHSSSLSIFHFGIVLYIHIQSL